jgi:hypothetical protein
MLWKELVVVYLKVPRENTFIRIASERPVCRSGALEYKPGTFSLEYKPGTFSLANLVCGNFKVEDLRRLYNT